MAGACNVAEGLFERHRMIDKRLICTLLVESNSLQGFAP